jgi:hypothetical protein
MSACVKNRSVQFEYDKNIPQVQFAIDEIEKAGIVDGINFSTPNPDVIINFALDKSLGKEEYIIKREKKTVSIRGGDANGLMYAGLELAEVIQDGKKLTKIGDITGKPYIQNRGIKFNIPLDARTPSYDDKGDVFQNNILEMWDFDFWQNYLDNLARYRYNLLTLWSLHPYPSMVRVPGFEDVALDDVCVYTNPITININKDWDGEDIQNPKYLKVVKKITIDEKMEFWKKVFKYAEDRGISIHIFHWNVYVMAAEGKYGITCDQENPVTADYTRESVKQFLLTYPNIKGIGVTAGEHVKRNITGKYSTENWMWLTYGQAIKEAQEINPVINPEFIFRQHETNLDKIIDAFKDYGKPIDTEFKYSRARMFSTATPPWFNRIYRKSVEEHGVKIWMTVRNDDILTFRWGDPVYASEYIKFMPKELMAGYFWGPDGYIYGRDFNSKNADNLPKYEIDKQWYLFMIYGRAGYNPDLPESFYVNRIKNRFPEVNAKKLYDTWRYTSDVISWLEKIHFRQNDFEWFAEGCFDHRQFHDIDNFARIPGLPDQGVSSIGDFVVNGIEEGKMTPFEVAEKLDNASQQLLQGVSQLKAGNNAELEQTLGDLKAFGYLAKYYSLKISAATNLSLFRLNGTEENKVSAVNQLEQALEAWKNYAIVANIHYKVQFFARHQTLDWDALTSSVAADIEIAQAAKQGEPVATAGTNALWERDMRHQ